MLPARLGPLLLTLALVPVAACAQPDEDGPATSRPDAGAGGSGGVGGGGGASGEGGGGGLAALRPSLSAGEPSVVATAAPAMVGAPIATSMALAVVASRGPSSGVYDVSRPEAITAVAPLPAAESAIFRGSTVWLVANGPAAFRPGSLDPQPTGSVLETISVADPRAPRRLGRLALPGATLHTRLAGERLLVASRESGASPKLWITMFDVGGGATRERSRLEIAGGDAPVPDKGGAPRSELLGVTAQFGEDTLLTTRTLGAGRRVPSQACVEQTTVSVFDVADASFSPSAALVLDGAVASPDRHALLPRPRGERADAPRTYAAVVQPGEGSGTCDTSARSARFEVWRAGGGAPASRQATLALGCAAREITGTVFDVGRQRAYVFCPGRVDVVSFADEGRPTLAELPASASGRRVHFLGGGSHLLAIGDGPDETCAGSPPQVAAALFGLEGAITSPLERVCVAGPAVYAVVPQRPLVVAGATAAEGVVGVTDQFGSGTAGFLEFDLRAGAGMRLRASAPPTLPRLFGVPTSHPLGPDAFLVADHERLVVARTPRGGAAAEALTALPAERTASVAITSIGAHLAEEVVHEDGKRELWTRRLPVRDVQAPPQGRLSLSTPSGGRPTALATSGRTVVRFVWRSVPVPNADRTFAHHQFAEVIDLDDRGQPRLLHEMDLGPDDATGRFVVDAGVVQLRYRFAFSATEWRLELLDLSEPGAPRVIRQALPVVPPKIGPVSDTYTLHLDPSAPGSAVLVGGDRPPAAGTEAATPAIQRWAIVDGRWTGGRSADVPGRLVGVWKGADGTSWLLTEGAATGATSQGTAVKLRLLRRRGPAEEMRLEVTDAKELGVRRVDAFVADRDRAVLLAANEQAFVADVGGDRLTVTSPLSARATALVALSGDLLVAYGREVFVADLSMPSSPRLIASSPVRAQPVGVAFTAGRLYVADGGQALQAIPFDDAASLPAQRP